MKRNCNSDLIGYLCLNVIQIYCQNGGLYEKQVHLLTNSCHMTNNFNILKTVIIILSSV